MAYIGTNHKSFIGNNPREITGDEIANNSITANNIVENTITTGKLDPDFTDRVNNSISSSYTHANSSFIHANSSFIHANSSFIQTNASFDVANSGSLQANISFNLANASFIQANTARNHANSAYNQANTSNSLAIQAAQIAGSKVSSVNNQNVPAAVWHLSKDQRIKTYGSTSWTGSLTLGTYLRSLIGGGHNVTDSPVEIMVSKYNEKSTTLAGDFDIPYDPSDEPAQLKRFYYNTTRGSWSQREELYRSETVTEGNIDAIGFSQLRYGQTWNDNTIYYNGHTPHAVSILATSGTVVEAGPINSASIPAGDTVHFRFNGVRAKITWKSSVGDAADTYSASDYGGGSGSWTNDTGGAVVISYSYFAYGDDPSRTFAKIYTTKQDTNYTTISTAAHLSDPYGTTWQYYWQNQRVHDGMINAPTVDGSSALDFLERRDRLMCTKTMTLPRTGSHCYSLCVKLGINKGLDGAQPGKESANVSNLFYTSNSGSVASPVGLLVTMADGGQFDRRVYLTVNVDDGAGGTSALVSKAKIWQFNNDDDEEITFHWSWNALDTVAPGRFYVNGLLVYTTTSNILGSLNHINIGAIADGTSNGFTGYLKMLSLMPESWGMHNVQGSISADWDLLPVDGSFTGTMNGTTYNGGATNTVMSGRAKMPRNSYIHSNSSTPDAIFPNGTQWYFDTTPYTQAGSTTASCALTAGDGTVTFNGNNRGGWHSYGGTYLVTGTGIPTTRNVYTTLSFGDKTFTLRTHNDDFNTPTSTTTSTLTFTRINGGRTDGYNSDNNGAYYFHDNPPSVVKATNTAKYFGNCIGSTSGIGNSSNAYYSPGAFPQITLALVTGSEGDGTSAGNPYLRTSATAANAGNCRRILNMLGIGKKFTITGTGIQAPSNDHVQTYVTGVEWDYFGANSHRISLSINTSANPSGTHTLFYVPNDGDTYHEYLDYTGGDWLHGKVNCSYDYSPLVTAGGAGSSTATEIEIEYGHGFVKTARYTPPKGVYDSGIFRATAGTTTRRVNINYAAMGFLINYGATGILGSGVGPTITSLTTQLTTGIVSVSTSVGNFYRIVIIPLSTNFQLS